ncbi:hypothetical protein DYI26_19385 [Halomonas litopenaei]|nr:hypothetical protein [Halomonas litopenaei]
MIYEIGSFLKSVEWFGGRLPGDFFGLRESTGSIRRVGADGDLLDDKPVSHTMFGMNNIQPLGCRLSTELATFDDVGTAAMIVLTGLIDRLPGDNTGLHSRIFLVRCDRL